jgi:hypothetical protein
VENVDLDAYRQQMVKTYELDVKSKIKRKQKIFDNLDSKE